MLLAVLVVTDNEYNELIPKPKNCFRVLQKTHDKR